MSLIQRGWPLKVLSMSALAALCGCAASSIQAGSEPLVSSQAPSASEAAAAPRHPDAPIFLTPGAPMRNRHEVVKVRLRDGVELVGDLYRPLGEGRYPVIIEVTPYGRRTEMAFVGERDYWPDQGYAYLILDVRGLHESGGRFGFFADAINDGYDVVEWAGVQPWSIGKVGMRGSSYTGSYPWYAAKNRPSHLRCINANASAARPFEEIPYQSGAFMLQWALNWISSLANSGVPRGTPVDWERVKHHRPLITADVAAYRRPLELYREILSHPTLDAFWRPISYRPENYAGISIPSLGFSGWFDGTLPGTIHNYAMMRAHSPASADQFLVVGPWEHLYVADGGWDYSSGKRVTQVGDLRFPDAAFMPGQRMTLQFFNWCLKGEKRPNFPSAHFYITGADRWLKASTYPAAGARSTAFYLAADGAANSLSGAGRLQPERPSGNGRDRFTYNPLDPFPSRIMRHGQMAQLNSNPIDIHSLLGRPDVLVYTSAPMQRPLTVLGNVRLNLFAASSARDTDFTAQIEDVAPDGTAVKLGPRNGGGIRARYRNGFNREQLLSPGKIERYDINLFDIGHQFRRGHRIRISVSSSAWPLLHANPNTGNPIATDTAEPRPAQQTVHRSAAHPSHLLLPIIDLPEPRS